MEDDFEKNNNNEFVDTSVEDIEEMSAERLKKMREKLKRCEEEKMSAMEDLQRTRADFLNAKKRLEEEKLQDRERVRIRSVEDILPLCDSFEMALEDKSFAETPENLQKGLRGIYAQITSLIKSYNAEQIGIVGEAFDPAYHEAIAEVGVDDKSRDHTITAVMQKGYRLGDNIIRPARVTVGVFKS